MIATPFPLLSSSTMPTAIGTLIVVILKANHLPNKRHIGKQDPYCLVSLNGTKQRTKVIKRGGQHPEWDEELRFTMYEEDESTGPNGTPPPPPPKDGKRKIQGGTIMKLSCFADDPREPGLIGQADVDLTEVLTKGETDEWFTLMNKDKFAGKVYLELTFFSNEEPPAPKPRPAVPQNNREYSGPGSFTASEEFPSGPSGANFPPTRIASTSSSYAHPRRPSDSTPPGTIRASHSNSQIEYYQPPYDQPQQPQNTRGRVASFSTLTNDFGDLSVGDNPRRRESFPPPQSTILGTYSQSGFHGYEPSVPESGPGYSYERPITPPYGNYAPPPAAPYRPAYDSGSGPYNTPPSRGPRYSMPATSSGFMPLSSSTSSGFAPLTPEPTGFAPTLPPTPAPPMNYSPSHINGITSYTPAPSQTPAPGYPPAPSTFQGLPPGQPYGYPQYQPPPVQYNTPPPPQPQQNYTHPPSPTHPPLTHSTSLSSSTGPGSRPLPQQPVHSQSLPPPPPAQYFSPPASQPSVVNSQPPGSYSPSHPSPSAFHESYSPSHPTSSAFHESYVPPPPQPYEHSVPYHSPGLPPPPPNGVSPRRQSSLPTPPTHHQQPTYVNPLPPPPPPPIDYSVPPPPPIPSAINQSQPYYPGPPPRPPGQLDGSAWMNQPPPPPPQHSYSVQSWN
ncbi:Calcineurin temperature suppressor Cts1 [Mycena indigotica]|uniref:Calcineurin temperature suppressor Cts1 n=1 Tax=Mycena indigotica TaxID=2126181 RepID=A0A8H6SKJ6_9AGAR|nr:Calcineurin temperature suppressor Cts1 [Mycena indigotica]KAF7301430.1 Calcineurin temperature suppressor Cts1 [Mycena indigotica]